MSFVNKLIISLLASAAVAVATWSEGGYGNGVVRWTSIFAGFMLILLIFSLLYGRLRTGKNVRQVVLTNLKPWVPAGIFAIIVAASLANVTHERILISELVNPHGGEEVLLISDGLRAKDSAPAYLPGTLSRALTSRQLQLHLSILTIGFVLWMLLTRRVALCILTLLVINGLILAIAGIYYHFNDNGLLLGRYESVNPRYFSAFRYHAHWSAFSLLTFTAGIGLAAFPGLTKGWRIAVLALVVASWGVFFYAATLAQSRSLVLLLIGVIVLAVVQLFRAFVIHRGTDPRAKRLLAPVACLLILGVGGAVFAGQKILEARAGDTTSMLRAWKDGHPPMRLLIARDSLKLVAAKPLWGWGLGCYRFAFTGVAGPEFREDERQHQTAFYGRLITTQFAHNDWLQYWSEIGTPAMFCLIATPWLLLRKSRRSGRRNATSYWCFGGCALILVHALWDFPLSNPAILLLTTVVFIVGAKLQFALGKETPITESGITSSRSGSSAEVK